MTYGTPNKELAEQKAHQLRAQHPENRYEVQGHQWEDHHSMKDGHDPTTWGLVEYVPYCEAMPERCTGFLWIF